MSLKDRLIETFGGVSKAAHDKALARAYESGIEDSEDEPPEGTLASRGYQAARAGVMRQGAVNFGQAMNAAWQLWQMNPVARRYLEIKRDYIIGQGVTPMTNDKDLQAILDDFWITNRMDEHVGEFAHQLFLFGIQVWPLYVRQSDGKIQIGYFDPSQVETVIPDPNNALNFRAVVLKERTTMNAWETSHGKQVYRIVQSDDEGVKVLAANAKPDDWEPAMLKAFGANEYAGDCLYTRVNAVSNQAMGLSDLVALADWLDQLDETLFSLGEREQMAGYFNFDVTMTGATPDVLRARQAELKLNPPRRGSVNLHNENETWECTAPDLKQAASIETVNEQLAFILGGMGIPVHWYGKGDETNRATAQAQGDPTWRSLQHAQRVVRDALVELLEVVRDQAIASGKYHPSEDADTAITLDMPAMTNKDTAAISASLAQIANSLLVAQENKWLTPEEAATIYRTMVADLGVELESVEEADLELDKEPKPAAQPLPPQLQPGAVAPVAGALPEEPPAESWRPALRRLMEETHGAE